MSVLIRRNMNSPMESFLGRSSQVFKDQDHDEDEDEEEEKTSSYNTSPSLSSSSSISVVEEEEEEDEEGEEEESLSVSLYSERGDGDGDEEVESELRVSLASLEDSLPIKRGLSNFFNGKAKSFTSLADVITVPTTAADLAKQEHPFNKRRRVLMAAKKKSAWPRRASCSALNILPHPSLLESELRVVEEDEEEEDGGDSPRLPPLPIIHGRGLKSFRSRAFSLTDLQLQQHDEFS